MNIEEEKANEREKHKKKMKKKTKKNKNTNLKKKKHQLLFSSSCISSPPSSVEVEELYFSTLLPIPLLPPLHSFYSIPYTL